MKFLRSTLPALLALGLLAFLQLRIANAFGDPDGWYHLGISQLYKSGLVTTKFVWLQDTILKDSFFDQQFLYHIVLSLHPTVLWAKLVTIAVAVALFFTLGAILNTQKVTSVYWWSLAGFLASSGFLFRANLVKGSMVGVLLFFCTVAILLKQKHWILAPLSALWLLSHGSFVLLLPLLISYCIVVKTSKKDIIKIFLYSVFGLLIGYIVHPQHVALIPYLATQLAVPLSGKHIASVGSEWYAYNFGSLIKYTSPLLFAWVCTIVWWAFSTYIQKSGWHKLRSTHTWLWLISIGWFCVFLSSKRFIEYWVPASIIPLAFTISPYISKIDVRHLAHSLKTSWQVAVGALALIACLATSVWYNTRNTMTELKNNARADAYESASQWLSQNTPAGSIVFNTRWDHFPQLFYWNTHNYYIVGLDPLFMYAYNPLLYKKWHIITDERPEGWNGQSVYETLKNNFHAQYIFIEDHRNPKLFDYINEQTKVGKNFELVFSTNRVSIFGIY